jgi:uncharacterized protein
MAHEDTMAADTALANLGATLTLADAHQLGRPFLVESLLRPEAYPHPAQRVRLEETHISWVFLAGRYVYKVKKPVDFGFLDYSTLERRRQCCEQEVQLNRRLCPDVYVGWSQLPRRPMACR